MPARGRVPRVMTFGEAEELLKVSRSTIQRLVRDGELQAVYIAGSRRLSAASVEAYLRRQVPSLASARTAPRPAR